MKKIIIGMLAIALMIPLMADAKKKDRAPEEKMFKTDFIEIKYSEPPWKLVKMQLPTAGQMAGDTAAQSANQRFGNVRVADPSGWINPTGQVIDAAIGTAQDTAMAGIGGAIIESKIKKAMPQKFAMATFKRFNPSVDIMFTMMEGSQSMTGMGGKAGKQKITDDKTKCSTLEQGKTSWGGRTADKMTMRCPMDNNQWQWTSMISMYRDGANYMLNTTYVSESSDISSFNSVAGDGIDMILRGTTFK